MPVTDLEKVNIHARRVMGRVDLKDRFLDTLVTSLRRHSKARTTGPAPIDDPDTGGWFTTITVVDGAGLNTLDFIGGDGGLYGSDGSGEFISVENGDDRINEVPFQDTAAVTYYLGVTTAAVPEGISTDTGTATHHYDRTRMEIGHLEEPTNVVDGGSTITFTLGNHQLNGSDDFTGRTAIVYLKDPVSGSATTAIEECTVSGISITTVGTLGQSVVSTVDADYEVILVGPTITRASGLQTAPGWAFIGTVIGGGSPRDFDFSDQPALTSLEDLSAQASLLLTKGWIDLPTVSSTATTISVTTTGRAFVNGRVRDTSTSGPHGSLSAASDVWLVWDDGLGDFEVYDDWDDANAANRVPLYWARTNGGSNIVAEGGVGRRLIEFNDTMTITVCTDTDQHAQFTTLRTALLHALSLQKGTGITPRGIVIEVLGDVTVSAVIDDEEIYELTNITIRGRSNRQFGSGSRIIWTHTGDALFDVVGASTVMDSWTFEDLTFVYDATGVGGEAVVKNVSGTIRNLVFRRCWVDGNTALVSLGGAGGSLPSMVHYESPNGGIAGLRIEECFVFTTDAMLLGSGPLEDLVVRDTTYVASGTAIGLVDSWIYDEVSTGQTRWRISGCEVTARGTAILATELSEAWIYDNNIFVTASAANQYGIKIGNNTFSGVNRIWIHDNRIERVSSATANVAVIDISAQNNGTDPGAIFVHSNAISGDGVASDDLGVSIKCEDIDLDGVILFGNAVSAVSIGIELNSLGAGLVVGPVVAGNYVRAGDKGVHFAGSGLAVVGGNYIETSEVSSITMDVDVADQVIASNALVAPGSGVVLDVDASSILIAGNAVSERVEINGSTCALLGNLLAENLTVSSTSADLAIAANIVAGSAAIDGDGHVIGGGNYFVGAFTGFASTQTDITLVGNRIADNTGLTFDHTRGTIVGNIIDAAGFALGVNSVDVAVVGNHLVDTTPTDNGTNNVLNDNT